MLTREQSPARAERILTCGSWRFQNHGIPIEVPLMVDIDAALVTYLIAAVELREAWPAFFSCGAAGHGSTMKYMMADHEPERDEKPRRKPRATRSLKNIAAITVS